MEGRFYELQEAYDLGLLTKADLESIAYWHNIHFRNGILTTVEVPSHTYQNGGVQ